VAGVHKAFGCSGVGFRLRPAAPQASRAPPHVAFARASRRMRAGF